MGRWTHCALFARWLASQYVGRSNLRPECELGLWRRTEPPDCQKRWRPTTEGEGQPPRGETAPGNCGCADAYEELPPAPPYDADTEIPRFRSNWGPGARETLRPEPAEAPEPGLFLPSRAFPHHPCAGFPCNLGLFKRGGGGGAHLAAWARRRPPLGWQGFEYLRSAPLNVREAPLKKTDAGLVARRRGMVRPERARSGTFGPTARATDGTTGARTRWTKRRSATARVSRRRKPTLRSHTHGSRNPSDALPRRLASD